MYEWFDRVGYTFDPAALRRDFPSARQPDGPVVRAHPHAARTDIQSSRQGSGHGRAGIAERVDGGREVVCGVDHGAWESREARSVDGPQLVAIDDQLPGAPRRPEVSRSPRRPHRTRARAARRTARHRPNTNALARSARGGRQGRTWTDRSARRRSCSRRCTRPRAPRSTKLGVVASVLRERECHTLRGPVRKAEATSSCLLLRRGGGLVHPLRLPHRTL